MEYLFVIACRTVSAKITKSVAVSGMPVFYMENASMLSLGIDLLQFWLIDMLLFSEEKS